MNRPSISLLLFVVAAVVTSPLTARAHDVRPGDRVRVFTTGKAGAPPTVTGTVVSIDGETLVVQTSRPSGNIRNHHVAPHDTATVALSNVTSLDRWTGAKNHTFTGAVIGAAAGLVIGFAARESSKTEGTEFGGGSDASGLATLLLGIIGTGVGALIGHSLQTDQWDHVESLSVAVTPAGEGSAQLAVALSFDL